MPKIKIGFLSPYSSIYPSMSKQIMDGFFAAMPHAILREQIFEFVPVFVGQGKSSLIKDAVHKLLYFDEVDIISGIINYRGAEESLRVIEKSGKLGFFFDLGENIPTLLQVSDRIFFNSFQLWQSEYALGYWAHNEFGDKGLVAISMYDSGYHLQNAFRQGTIDAGSQELDYLLFQGNPGPSPVMPLMDQFYQAVEKNKPAYVHAIFCGNEALEFLNAYNKSSFKNTIPLLLTAHMASDEILSRVNAPGVKLFAASMYNYESDNELNRKFKSAYTNLTGQRASFFSLMGYEMGIAFREVYQNIARKDWETVARYLKEQTLISCRGIRSFYHGSAYSVPVIDIEKIEFRDLHTVNKMVINQGKALQFNHRVFDEIHREAISGWLNPYLCV